MLKKHRTAAEMPVEMPTGEEEGTLRADWESLALLLSCGGAFIPQPHPGQSALRTVHTPGQRTYLLREDDPTSYLVMDAALQDERKFCASVSRLLHSPSRLQSFMNEHILRSEN
jgi:hypothetical protein